MKSLLFAISVSCCFLFSVPSVSLAEGPLSRKPEGAKEVSKDRELEILYDTAREFFKEKKYYGAKALLLDVKELNPNFRATKYYLTAVERKLAARRAGGASEPDAKRLKLWYNEGLYHFRNQEYQEARSRFHAVMEIEPGFMESEDYLAKSDAALKAGAGAGAKPGATPVKAAQQGEEVNKLLDEAYRLESAGKIKEAIPYVRTALGKDPGNAAAKRQLNRLQEALSKTVTIKKVKPRVTVSLDSLEAEADALYREDKLEEARAAYLEILSRAPSNRLAAGMVNVINRKQQTAAKTPSQDEIPPAGRRALLSKAREALLKGDNDHARDLLVNLLLMNPEDADAKDLLNRVDLTEARHRSKEKNIEKEMAESAKTGEELRRIRELRKLTSDRRFEQVVKVADQLLRVRPHWPEVDTIRDLALHNIESDKQRRIRLEDELGDHRALRELEAAAIPPEDQAPLPRPRVIVHKPALELKSIKDKLAQKVSVNLVEADLSYVLDLLFRATGVNIVANPEMLADQQITIHVENMPLQELLSYISRNYGILFSASSSAVWVSTPDQPFLETQIRYLTKGLTDVTEAADSTSSDVEKLLERIPELIEWPDGSSYYVDRKKNILFLRSTPEALVHINELVDEVDRDPIQVLIETRFVELKADNSRDIDVDFTLMSDVAALSKRGANKVQVDAGAGVAFTGLPNARGAVQDGLSMAISGVLTDPQFQLVIRALEESNIAKTLSNPRIMALSNYPAEIEILRDLIYIEDYEVDRADISGSTVGGTDTTTTTGAASLTSEPIIIPTFATGEQTGFRLRVTASVGADHKNISLILEPEISEKVDEISFKLVIPDFDGDAPIERPIISTRRLTTKVTIEDGAVLVLAGLMRSQKLHRNSKIPLLSDLPILGGLFRSESIVDEKTNLLIFVKATIVDGSGRKFFDPETELDARVRVEEEGAGQAREALSGNVSRFVPTNVE